MGSSSVMMCFSCVRLMASMMQASVVDLPLPAGPVTSTSPLLILLRSMTCCGMPRAAASGSENWMTRTTAASEPRCR